MNMNRGLSSASTASESVHSTNQKPPPQANQIEGHHSASGTNGDVDIKQLVHYADLEENELISRVKEICDVLKRLTDYDQSDVWELFYVIYKIYFCDEYTPLRTRIGDVISEAGFAALAIKVLEELYANRLPESDLYQYRVIILQCILWNFTDSSLKLAQSVAEVDGVKFFTDVCSNQHYLSDLQNENVFQIVLSSLSILHNVSRNSEVVYFFKENKTQEAMLPFLNCSKDKGIITMVAMLTIAHIVDEEDNEKLVDETGAIKTIIKYTRRALKKTDRRYEGFTPQELIDGLGRLAVNDKNKNKIIKSKALPVLLKLLSGNVEEQVVAARTIWTLSFDKEVCQEIVQYPEMLSTLQQLHKSSENKDVLRLVNGALFVLKGENDVSRRKSTLKRNKGHIFLSYCRADKQIVYRIKDRLQKDGHEVWIDIENMTGHTLEAMAEAVQNAAVVLICMSQKYKDSPNCRLEAEYTHELKKNFIPLMMQMKYRPDGWLGIIRGSRIYCDFSGKYPFDEAWEHLEKELKSLGCFATHSSVSPGKDEIDGPVVRNVPSTTATSPPSSLSTTKHSHTMTVEDVSNWLRSAQLDGVVQRMSLFDGRRLMQLRKMKSEAPEFYYQCLKKRLKMDLLEILTFTEELEKL